MTIMNTKSCYIGLAAICGFAFICCDDGPPTNDAVQRNQQEALLKEGTSQVGLPNIKNFRERRILKDILELRDQTGYTTYTYIFSEQLGKLVFLCESIGYGIPYSTQFTNPMKVEFARHETGVAILPQADPNGLFSPASADGTWVMCKDPHGTEVRPVLIEPRAIFSPFKFDDSIVLNRAAPAPAPSASVK